MSSSCLQQLLKRSSTRDLQDPAPSGEILKQILEAGLCAPHRGRIKPWKWILIQGEDRKPFAEAIRAASIRVHPDISKEKLECRVSAFMDAPLVIGIGGIFEDSCFPLNEQRYAVAAGAMNILNALHFEGFSGIWLSGAFCDDKEFLKYLGLQDGELLGFILAGTPNDNGQTVDKKRPDLNDHVLNWYPKV